MTNKEVASTVREQIGDDWSKSDSHRVDLSRCLVSPTKINVIARSVQDGKTSDAVIGVWLVLEEDVRNRDGYKIIFEEAANRFGLASPGFPSDAYPILVGWYSDFMTAFEGM